MSGKFSRALSVLLTRVNSIKKSIGGAFEFEAFYSIKGIYRLLDESQKSCLEIIKDCEALKDQIIKESLNDSKSN